jgi:hypothetical protein
VQIPEGLLACKIGHLLTFKPGFIISYDLVGIPPVPDWLVEGDVPHRKVPFLMMTPVEYSPSPVGRLLYWPGLACALRAPPYAFHTRSAEWVDFARGSRARGVTELANICQVALHQAQSVNHVKAQMVPAGSTNLPAAQLITPLTEQISSPYSRARRWKASAVVS